MAMLAQSAGSSRVLNLIHLNDKIERQDNEPAKDPFFKTDVLNKGIVLKSRLQGSEKDLFSAFRANATKLLLPYDTGNLRVGGKSTFIGEIEFPNILRDHFGIELNSQESHILRDLDILRILDELPSLDPFLLKERMMMAEMKVDERYFDISPADWREIRDFVREEFYPLATMTVGPKGATRQFAEMMTNKLWEGRDLDALGPLLDALKLDRTNAKETLFAWKGILYYKFMFETLRDKLASMVKKMQAIRIVNFRDNEHRKELHALRDEVAKELKTCLAQTAQTLETYETNYHERFLRDKDPGAFRSFLKSAPQMFTSLGPNIAAVDHSISFWSYRFDRDGIRVAEATDLEDVLLNFSTGV